MKIEIDDELVEMARERAEALGVDMRLLIEAVIRRELCGEKLYEEKP